MYRIKKIKRKDEMMTDKNDGIQNTNSGQKNSRKLSELMEMDKNGDALVRILEDTKEIKLYKYDDDTEKAFGKNFTNFYLDVLRYLIEDEGLDLNEIRPYNTTGSKLIDGKEYHRVGTFSLKNQSIKITVNTNFSTVEKFKNLTKYFEKIQGFDSSLYKMEWEYKHNSNSNEKNDAFDDSIRSFISDSIEKNKQVIFTGAPGTGKTYSVRKYVEDNADENQFKFVQFHPSYDYTDFVEGLRPVILEDNAGMNFVRMDGIFKEFCRHIVEEDKSDKKYYFIVDEINRADLSKVFGELMFGLEESYRGEEYKILTQYRNLPTYRMVDGKAQPLENDVFKDGFYIPKNLYFIGTMNDIDRSVDSMDFALRRRFTWIEIKANDIMEEALKSIFFSNEDTDLITDLSNRIIEMNHIISSNFGLTDAYHIGPAYFKNLELKNWKDSLKSIFENNIRSILREYTRGRGDSEVSDFIEECRNALLNP